MKTFLTSLLLLLIISGCEEKDCIQNVKFETYTLDVSNVESRQQDNTIVQAPLRTYNPVMMAIFPVDFGTPNKIVKTLNAETIFLAQTKNPCSEGNGRTKLMEDHPIVRMINDTGNNGNLSFKNAGHVVAVNVEMPYAPKTYQGKS